MATHTQAAWTKHSRLSSEMQRCIQECQNCHSACLEAVQYCVQKGGPHADAMHIRSLLDCAEICQTSANYMLRNSPLHTQTCAVRAEVCERCAQSCEQFADDAMMRHCAETCRRCAESCHSMARMAM